MVWVVGQFLCQSSHLLTLELVLLLKGEVVLYFFRDELMETGVLREDPIPLEVVLLHLFQVLDSRSDRVLVESVQELHLVVVQRN